MFWTLNLKILLVSREYRIHACTVYAVNLFQRKVLLAAVNAEAETYIPEYELQQNEPILIRYFKKR